MISIVDNKRYLKWDGKYLYLKVEGQVSKLGLITTLKGRITRVQKLRAVAHTNEWVEI